WTSVAGYLYTTVLIRSSYNSSGRVVDVSVRVAALSLESLAADVAVLSACDTALGKHVPSEGLLGIGSTMLARGARAVVASLWPVSDEIGARLMTEFYRHLLRDSMSPAAALGAAMRSVVSSGAADPALWAAYQVSVVALGPGPPAHGVASRGPGTATRPLGDTEIHRFKGRPHEGAELETRRMRAIQAPARVERLLDGLISDRQLSPKDSYQIRDPAAL